MKKLDSVVRRETLYIALFTLALSVPMEAVFLIFGWFDYTVPLGNLLGAAAAVLNFFLLGITVQAAIAKDKEAKESDDTHSSEEGGESDDKPAALHKEARQLVKLSHTLRSLMLFVFCVVGVLVPCFHTIAVLIPLLFPRIAVMVRPWFFGRADKEKGGEN